MTERFLCVHKHMIGRHIRLWKSHRNERQHQRKNEKIREVLEGRLF